MINVRTGPADGGPEGDAEANVAVFVTDLRERGVEVLKVERNRSIDDGERLYGFDLVLSNGETIKLEMPGLPIQDVRYIRLPGQDPNTFPRLYVDNSSWLWFFALETIRRP